MWTAKAAGCPGKVKEAARAEKTDVYRDVRKTQALVETNALSWSQTSHSSFEATRKLLLFPGK